jgi:Bacterial protein of unknown function (HtrL_YibB)
MSAELRRAKVASFPFEAAVQATLPATHQFKLTPAEFYDVPGKQHYRFLAALAATLNGATIIDIGTHMGSSALALATNPANQVISFDIHRKTPLRDLSNVSFELADLWDPVVRKYWEPTLLASSVILLDVDPHNGTMEWDFYCWLKEKQYKGLLICDDIWYFKPMRDEFWFKVPTEEKLDITNLGHWSGTGLIFFTPQPLRVETLLGLQEVGGTQPSADAWTIVSAYFDLTRMPDASPAICARDRAHYFTNAVATMNVDANLVVYCEPDSVETLKAMRPERLASKTRYEIVDFETLPLTKYRSTIQENRRTHPYHFDERNTASYYLFCMSRYSLLKRTMDENPFGSTHFAWLNLCIERMGYQNVAHLEEIFKGPPEDLVKVCYIDYLARDFIADLPKYFQWGRCSLCSGFFTGGRDAFYEFCTRIEDKFLEYLKAGYGHADEQLYSSVYFEAPHIFKPYFGDYQQMCTNYRHCYENPDITTRLLLPKAVAAGDWRTVQAACEFLEASVAAETIQLNNTQKMSIQAARRALAEQATNEIVDLGTL